MKINNNQSVVSDDIKKDDVKQNILIENKKCQKQTMNQSCNKKLSKVLLLAVSSNSVHTLAYNCIKNDQFIVIERLNRWLEWRQSVTLSSIYKKMGLTNSQLYGQLGGPIIKGRSSANIDNLDLLLDFKSYANEIGENESRDNEKNSRLSGRSKPNDNDLDDKKNKPNQVDKDFQDIYIEHLVNDEKVQHHTGELVIFVVLYLCFPYK